MLKYSLAKKIIFIVFALLLCVAVYSFAGPTPQSFESSSLLQQLFAYDAGGNVEYIGWSIPGVAVTEARWIIKKFTYDVNGNVTAISFAGGRADFAYVWNDRATYFN